MGWRPWNSPYRECKTQREEPYGADTPEQIEKCMSCPYPACINCLDTKSAPKYDAGKVIQLILAGKRTALICRALGVRESTVMKLREELEGRGLQNTTDSSST